MDSNKNQELSIVNAVSQIDLPHNALESNLFKVITDLQKAKNKVDSNLKRLVEARSNYQEGNWVGNWWHDREDKLKDAQLDLNKSLAELNKQSSTLLLINTAVSKMLVSQQNLLHEQQEHLKQHANELAEQNKKIQNSQAQMLQAQDEITRTNQDLLGARRGLMEQSEKLMECVKRIDITEQEIKQSNQEMEHRIFERINSCSSDITETRSMLDKKEADLKKAHQKFLYISVLALIAATLSMATSVYVFLSF